MQDNPELSGEGAKVEFNPVQMVHSCQSLSGFDAALACASAQISRSCSSRTRVKRKATENKLNTKARLLVRGSKSMLNQNWSVHETRSRNGASAGKSQLYTGQDVWTRVRTNQKRITAISTLVCDDLYWHTRSQQESPTIISA